MTLKLNLGCGHNKIPGYINVDKDHNCEPDVLFRLTSFQPQTPWPWETSSVSEVLFIHSLEHMGQRPSVFLGLIKELYRVCASNATIKIAVPHPRSDDFLGDPTHVRPISPQILELFSKRLNNEWVKNKYANSCLALSLDVDFEIETASCILYPEWEAMRESGQISNEQLIQLARTQNNIGKEWQIIWRAVK